MVKQRNKTTDTAFCQTIVSLLIEIGLLELTPMRIDDLGPRRYFAVLFRKVRKSKLTPNALCSVQFNSIQFEKVFRWIHYKDKSKQKNRKIIRSPNQYCCVLVRIKNCNLITLLTSQTKFHPTFILIVFLLKFAWKRLITFMCK